MITARRIIFENSPSTPAEAVALEKDIYRFFSVDKDLELFFRVRYIGSNSGLNNALIKVFEPDHDNGTLISLGEYRIAELDKFVAIYNQLQNSKNSVTLEVGNELFKLEMNLIASRTNILGGALGTTLLNFVTGKNLSNTIPVFIRVIHREGDYNQSPSCLVSAKLGGNAIMSIDLGQSGQVLDANNYRMASFLSTVMKIPKAGNCEVEVTQINPVAAQFDVEIWGIYL